MSIHFTPQRWEKVKSNHRKWWSGELKRPLIAVTLTGYEADRPEPPVPAHNYASYYDRSVTPEQIVDRWDYELSTYRYLGDAFPTKWLNFGPGVVAALTGCELHNDNRTVWFHAPRKQEISDLQIRLDEKTFWFQRIATLARAAMDRWQGAVQVGMTDLGGNLDIISSFRPSEELLLDLYDYPNEVIRVREQVHEVWIRCFEAFNKVLRPPNPGYTAWTPIFSEEPYYMLQCDLAYMLGPDMFNQFVLPELAACCRKIPHGFYHLDGVGQLPHLDSLLTIKELKGVQWIPGAGKPDVSNCPEVYRKIREAGKLIQVFGSQYPGNLKTIDVLERQLGSAEGIILLAGAKRSQEAEVRRFLEEHGVDPE